MMLHSLSLFCVLHAIVPILHAHTCVRRSGASWRGRKSDLGPEASASGNEERKLSGMRPRFSKGWGLVNSHIVRVSSKEEEDDFLDVAASLRDWEKGSSSAAQMQMSEELTKSLLEFKMEHKQAGTNDEIIEVEREIGEDNDHVEESKGKIKAANKQPDEHAPRATRKQRMGVDDLENTHDLLEKAGTDRRSGWRASKAKGNRRNRRYENRMLKGLEG
eukprot:jgi/Bigna1/88260/estExt_fgenesh1_pg.C_300007